MPSKQEREADRENDRDLAQQDDEASKDDPRSSGGDEWLRQAGERDTKRRLFGPFGEY